MQYADLSSTTQFLMVGLLAVAGSCLLTRAIFVARRDYARSPSSYPDAWSAAQCRSVEYFRLFVGVALIPLWGSFLYLAPSMPTNWPFGYVEMIILILLLLISNVWVPLLVPDNWKKFGAISRSFWITMTFLIVWWGAMFTAAGWMLPTASASPQVHIFGVYAALGVLPLTEIVG